MATLENTIDINTITERFTISGNDFDGFTIARDGITLTNRYGSVRIFATRNSARKRIARERSGNFHS